MGRFIEGIEHVASAYGLPISTVRYWAETRGKLLGIHRLSDGDWRFSPEAVKFFQRLAGEFQRGANSTTAPISEQQRTIGNSAGPRGGTAEFAERFEEIELQITHLLEETKQVQQLLSDIIQLLMPPTLPGEKPRVVRPFKPRRL